jgi:glycosyltransferase involved in cell wall biosynthesis
VEPDDTAAFVDAAKRLRDHAEERVRMGNGGRSYAESRFDLRRIADRSETVFAEAMAQRRR